MDLLVPLDLQALWALVVAQLALPVPLEAPALLVPLAHPELPVPKDPWALLDQVRAASSHLHTSAAVPVVRPVCCASPCVSSHRDTLARDHPC